MKDPFDMCGFQFLDKGEHPVVIISHPDRCARAAVVNVLCCTTQRQSRQPYPYEVMLNGADGMDWETFCDCSIIYAVKSDLPFDRRRHVTLERRRSIRAKLCDLFRLAATD